MAGPIRLLHVEDNDFFATVAATELEATDENIAVERVDRAAHALDALEEATFDCVLSDYEMPGMDGLELLEAVRERDLTIPFILLTGGGSETVASEAITRGVTDYFQKRTGVEQFKTLANRIGNAVARQRAEQAVEKQVSLNDLVWDLGQRLLEASTRERIEQVVCDGLVESSLYRHAWIGAFDDVNGSLVPRTTPEGTTRPIHALDGATDEIRFAVRSGEVVVTTETVAASDERLGRAIVPLVAGGSTYGTVNVYAEKRSAFERTERQTLGKFGDLVAHAIDSVKTRHALGRREQRLQVLNRVLRHNLRNDMTVILGYAENLIEELAPDQSVAEARTIQQKAREVTEVSAKASEITETLERADDARGPVEVTGLLERKVEEFRERFPRAEITYETPPAVWVDADFTVATAIEEVIENALVHNDRESPSVQITVSVLDRGTTDRIQITVEDDAPPIPASERDVLLEGRETALQHSSGLGLWLVNWIVDKFGGEVTFAGENPRGNVVTMELGAAKPIKFDGAERAAGSDVS